MPDLAELANELNAMADKATEAIRERELRFEMIRAGIDAQYEWNGIFLAYKKHNGRWRIMIDAKPALEAKREARIEAAMYLDNLEAALADKIRTTIKQQRRFV
jgi:hypothetical protein